jgi:hypothetical protein
LRVIPSSRRGRDWADSLVGELSVDALEVASTALEKPVVDYYRQPKARRKKGRTRHS